MRIKKVNFIIRRQIFVGRTCWLLGSTGAFFAHLCISMLWVNKKRMARTIADCLILFWNPTKNTCFLKRKV